MEILVVGSRGGFGQAVTNYLEKGGHTVRGISRGDRIPEDLSGTDACILAVPVGEIGPFVDALGSIPVIEISSTKAAVSNLKGKIVSIHPMFGPRSIEDARFHDIIYITDISMEGGKELISQLFPGFNTIEMTSAQHDDLMSDLLVKPYILSLLADSVLEEDTPVTGSSHRIFKDLAAISRSESRRVLEDSIRLNPNTSAILDRLMEELDSYRETLGRGKYLQYSNKSKK